MQSFTAPLRILQCVAALSGADDALAAINTSEVSPGAIVMVRANYSLYVLHKDSTATADGSNIVAPAQGGPGRWFKYGVGATYFQQVDVGVAAIPPQSSVDAAAAVLGVASAADIIVFNVLDSGLANGVTVTGPRVTGSGTATFRFTNATAATVAAATVALEVAIL